MYVGALYNSFVTFIAGTVGLLVFWQLYRLRKRRKIEYSKGIDYFLLLYGLLWIFVALRTFFVWLGRFDLEMAVWNWFTGPLTYIHILPGVFYFGWSLFKKKIHRNLFIWLLSLGIFLSVFTFFKYGSIPGVLTYWGTKPVANQLTQKIFLYGLFFPILVCIVIDFFRRLINWRRTKIHAEKQLAGFNFAFLVYASTAIFDALALAQGWTLLLVRTGVMLSALIFYLSATSEAKA